MIVKFEQSDSSILDACFRENHFVDTLQTISDEVDNIDATALENNQTYRQIIALKSVLVKANELSKLINKTYLDNIK